MELAPQTIRRNISFAALNSFFVEAAMTLSEGSTVLTLFIKALGGSNFMVGLLPSLQFFGWLTPQFFAAGRLQRLARFVPTVQRLEVVRSSFYLIMAVAAFVWGREQPQVVLSLFFVLYLVTRVAAGSSAVARAEIVARMVTPRERPIAISMRSLAGGVAGFLSGIAVRAVLDARVSQFPNNYATLLGLSGLSFALAIAALGQVKEPLLTLKPRKIDWLQQLRRAPALLGADRRYPLYLGIRVAYAGLEMVAPFYVIYATDVLGAPAAMAGVYIAVRTFTRVLSNMFWGEQCKRHSNLAVLRVSCLLGFIAPALVVMLPRVLMLLWPGGIPAYAMWLFSVVFLMQGLGGAAYGISELAYLYEIAPEEDRPTYFGLINTILGPLYFLSALAGALLDWVGYVPIFGVAAASIGVGYLLATRLAARERTRKAEACPVPAGE